MEKSKKICNDATKGAMLTLVLSELTIIRKAFANYIKSNSMNNKGSLSLISNASPKLQELIKILNGIKCTDICLVFVDRRTTAKILYHFIKVLFFLLLLLLFNLNYIVNYCNLFYLGLCSGK